MNTLPDTDIKTPLLSVIEFQSMFRAAESMAIVGSSSSVMQWQNGTHIDSHDIVVRFNRTTVDGKEKNIGARTDIIVANDANRLSKAPSPEFASRPRCVVTYVNTPGIGVRSSEQQREFLEWVGNTPLFLCAGPEVMCCEIPPRKRGFSMGTYAMLSLPYFLNIKRLFVTGFTMFGQSAGGADHHTKKSSQASCTWHDADLERYVAANVLGHLSCDLVVTREVAEFMEREGHQAQVLEGQASERRSRRKPGLGPLWYGVERLSKLFLTTGYQLRRIAEQRLYSRRKG